jgi:manganese-dependent inorganic pyrophosphatase
MIKVFGHISPDTDATGSAILWAWYMNHVSEPAKPYVLGPINKETSFVLSKWGIPEPELLENLAKGDEVMIVDTNNPQELPGSLGEASIKRIIDHHLLVGGLSTKSPVEVTMRPLACTATIIHDIIGEGVSKMPKEMKGLMLSCILSDTLAFRSPTTTSHDKDVAEKLAKDLGVSIENYSQEMFSAKSDVSDFTDKGLIHLDSKKFQVGDKNIRVSSLETTNPKSILDRKAGIVKAIKEVIEEDGDIDDVLLFVVDILKEEATVLLTMILLKVLSKLLLEFRFLLIRKFCLEFFLEKNKSFQF